MYCAGWVKRGPVGIIDATLRDSMETFKMIKHHLEHDMLPERFTTIEETRQLFKSDSALVDLLGWQKIDKEELSRG